MNRSFSLAKYARRDRKNQNSWKVEGSGPDGRRVRKFFPSRAQAASYAKDANNETRAIGWQAMGLTDAQRTEAASCYAELAPLNCSLKTAVHFYIAHQNKVSRCMTLKSAVAEILDEKSKLKLSGSHMRTMRCHFRAAVKKFGDKAVSTLTRHEIQAWLHSRRLPPPSFKSVRTHLVILFEHCVREGYMDSNPAKNIPLPKSTSTPPGILSVPALNALLQITGKQKPQMMAAIAIQALAGIRREEITKLDWREIRFDGGLIEVTTGKSKTAQRRLVVMCDKLRDILKPLQKPSGPVVPKSFGKHSAELRQSLISSGFLWPKNALRHSFASYHLALHQDAAKTALQLGHKDTGTLFEHYRALVTESAARAWFGVAG